MDYYLALLFYECLNSATKKELPNTQIGRTPQAKVLADILILIILSVLIL